MTNTPNTRHSVFTRSSGVRPSWRVGIKVIKNPKESVNPLGKKTLNLLVHLLSFPLTAGTLQWVELRSCSFAHHTVTPLSNFIHELFLEVWNYKSVRFYITAEIF